MARIQGRVARSYNRRHRFFGRLWQSRYKARIIDTNDYFRQVVAYVHLNPVSAGLVGDPGDFEQSGHAALIGKDRGSVTRWLRLGICRQRDDPMFRERLNSLDRVINHAGSAEKDAGIDTMPQC